MIEAPEACHTSWLVIENWCGSEPRIDDVLAAKAKNNTTRSKLLFEKQPSRRAFISLKLLSVRRLIHSYLCILVIMAGGKYSFDKLGLSDSYPSIATEHVS